MRKELRSLYVILLLAIPMVALAHSPAAQPQEEKKQRSEAKYREKLAKEVRHQLVMLPWYSVFDNLAYKMEGDKVILSGQVTRPPATRPLLFRFFAIGAKCGTPFP